MNQYLEIILMFVKAFLVGGAICLIAQVIINFTKLTAGKILVYFMLAGVVLQALGLYQYLVDFAGAGATVPHFGLRLSAGERRHPRRAERSVLRGHGFARGGERGRHCSGRLRVYLCAHLQIAQQKELITDRRGNPPIFL